MVQTTHFFLGANSASGFVNLFDEICRPDELQDLVILKGVPGCGKSTFMKRLGSTMEAKGERTEYIHCSGDPMSLDGVYFPDRGVLYVDGTAPHVVEPKYPCAADRVLDFGQYCNLEKLKHSRKEILARSHAKTHAYRQAYRALEAAKQIEDNIRSVAERGFDSEKLMKRAEGIAHREIRGKGTDGRVIRRFLGSYTCLGPIWRFDTVRALCPKLYRIVDHYGLGEAMLSRFSHEAYLRGYGQILCPDPDRKDRIHHVLLPELGLGFVTEKGGMSWEGETWRTVRIDPMADKEYIKTYRGKLRHMEQMVCSLREEAVDALQDANREHSALEAMYRPAMDYEEADRALERERKRLLT